MSILVNVVRFAASVLWQHDGRITGFDPGGRKEGRREVGWRKGGKEGSEMKGVKKWDGGR